MGGMRGPGTVGGLVLFAYACSRSLERALGSRQSDICFWRADGSNDRRFRSFAFGRLLAKKYSDIPFAEQRSVRIDGENEAADTADAGLRHTDAAWAGQVHNFDFAFESFNSLIISRL